MPLEHELPHHHPADRSVDPTPEDLEMESRARTALATAGHLPVPHIHVEVRHGIATITGKVQEPWQSELAGDVVSRSEGIARVLNELVVEL